MRQISVTLYQFDELSDSAKERARNWLRPLVFSDSSDWSHVYNDVQEVAARIGIDINRRTYRTVGGGTGTEPTIYFSGFSSQGDGACFEARYKYAKGSAKAVREYAPQDTKLHRIADRLAALQKRYSYKLEASTKHSGHYYHSVCMHVEVVSHDDIAPNVESELTGLLREFADWIYKQLEQEHDYRTSDEQIDETIQANEYEFTEDGERA